MPHSSQSPALSNGALLRDLLVGADKHTRERQTAIFFYRYATYLWKMWCWEKCKRCWERFLSIEAEHFVVTLSTSLQLSSTRTCFKSKRHCTEWNIYIAYMQWFTRAEGKAQLQTAQSVLLFRSRSVSAALSSTPLVLLLLQTWGQKEADGGEAKASKEYREVEAEI